MNIDKPREQDRETLYVLWQKTFGDSDKFLESFYRIAYSPDRARCVYDGDKPIAALYWFDCEYDGERLAYLYAVATDKEYRGRGIGTALLEDTHRHLVTLGYSGAVLVPAEPSLFDFYSERGYKVCSEISEARVAPGAEFVTLSRLGSEEYGRLRRALLPVSGIIQEGYNLDFLAEDAEFYSGDGFVLACREVKGELFCIELLGDCSKAPAILYTLGYRRGVFRTPGKGKPFAMFKPLVSSASEPGYFGLAFD